MGGITPEGGKETRTPHTMRRSIWMLAAACVAMAGLSWPHLSALAQEEVDVDIEALRKAAESELLTDDVMATEQPARESDGEKEKLSGDLANFFAMQICLLAVVLVLHTYTGMHIIRRGIIFCDLVLDQLAAFGIVVGIALGIKYGTPQSYLMAMGATLVGCVLLAVIRPRNRLIPQDAVIGIMYGMVLIASLLLADKLPTGDADLKNTLVGSMSWVSWKLVGVTAGAYLALLVFHYIFRKRMIHITESGENVPWRVLWDFLFFLSQGIITILIVPVAGVLLAYGFLMIPAAIGVIFTRGWRTGLLIGWTSGMAACLLGLFFSYRSDSPYGPSLLLSMGIFFMIALVARACFSGKVKGGVS